MRRVLKPHQPLARCFDDFKISLCQDGRNMLHNLIQIAHELWGTWIQVIYRNGMIDLFLTAPNTPR
jgi:hypothetical protein